MWTSCPAGTRKAEGSAALPSGVQQRCPRAPTPEPGKGRRPKNRHSSKAKRVSARVFCLLPVLACLWRGFPGPGSLVLRPCPFGFLFVLFRLMFLFLGRGRHVPAPSGRDVGSSAGAPTQEPELGTDPRTGFYRYPSTYDFDVYLVAPDLFFPFSFAILFVVVLVLGSLYPSLLQLTHSLQCARPTSTLPQCDVVLSVVLVLVCCLQSTTVSTPDSLCCSRRHPSCHHCHCVRTVPPRTRDTSGVTQEKVTCIPRVW